MNRSDANTTHTPTANTPADNTSTPSAPSAANTSNPATTGPALFALGHVVATPAVLAHLNAHGLSALTYLKRHQRGDWGEVPAEDAQENTFSVTHGSRILSAYTIAGERIWIITEADRSSTCLLFPEEY